MQHVEWTPELEIGINVIDTQHRRIVDYINVLIDSSDEDKRDEIALLIDSLVDYTYSHFSFEEALMEEAGYEFLSVHQQTHEAFIRKMDSVHQSFKQGDDVRDELCELLKTWLINHIMSDDQSYAPVVREKYAVIENKANGGWLNKTLHRFFG